MPEHERDSESYKREIALLREALLPFARKALSRESVNGKAADTDVVFVTLGECRAAQRAMAAD